MKGGDRGIQYLVLFPLLCHQVSCSIQQQTHISLRLSFAVSLLVETFILPFTSFSRFNSNGFFAFLTSSHAQTVSLYFCITWPYFSLVGFLFEPEFNQELPAQLCRSFAIFVSPPNHGNNNWDNFQICRWWFPKINKYSCTSLLSRALSHGIIQAVPWRNPRLLSWGPGLGILFVLLPPVRILNSSILWSLWPKLLPTFTCQTSSLWFASMRCSKSPCWLCDHLC